LDYSLDTPVPFQHLLMMCPALDWRATPHRFTQDPMDVVLSFLVRVFVDEIQLFFEKLQVFCILSESPLLFVVLEVPPGAEQAFFLPVKPRTGLWQLFFCRILIVNGGLVITVRRYH